MRGDCVGELGIILDLLDAADYLDDAAALLRFYLEAGADAAIEDSPRLLRDPELGPVALLAEKHDRRPDEVSPAEAAWLMAGSLLEFLEIGGPDAVREQLAELSRSQREDVVRAVRDSGYPARETLEDFRVLVAEPILSAPSRPGS